MIKRTASTSIARVTRVTRDEYRSQSLNMMRKPSSTTKSNNQICDIPPVQSTEEKVIRVPTTVIVQHVSRLNSTIPEREPITDTGNVSVNISALSFYSHETRNSCRSRRSLETTHDLIDRDLRSAMNRTKQDKRRFNYRYRCCSAYYPCCSPCCCLVTGILLSILLASLATLIALIFLSKPTTTTTTTTTTTQTTTTSTTSTTTTSTTTTSTSTTTSTTSTSSTSSTTSTSTTSTSSTSTSTTATTTTTTTRTTSTSATTTTATTTTTASTVSITSNTCNNGWSGFTVFDFCTNCPDINPYQKYTYTYTAIASFTRIAFALRENVGYFALDDVSVRSVTAPTVEILTNGGFETGSYSPWIYCNPSGSSAAGTLKTTSNNFYYGGYTYAAHSGNYYYLDGAVGMADYLSQVFPTTIGETYTISFWLYNQGSGSNSDAKIIMSI